MSPLCMGGGKAGGVAGWSPLRPGKGCRWGGGAAGAGVGMQVGAAGLWVSASSASFSASNTKRRHLDDFLNSTWDRLCTHDQIIPLVRSTIKVLLIQLDTFKSFWG